MMSEGEEEERGRGMEAERGRQETDTTVFSLLKADLSLTLLMECLLTTGR